MLEDDSPQAQTSANVESVNTPPSDKVNLSSNSTCI